MARSFASHVLRPMSGSWLANWSERRQAHPDSFLCGVRTPGGGRTDRWRYRRSAVDPLLADGVVTLYHGTKDTVQLRLDPDPYQGQSGPGPRPGLIVLAAATVENHAPLLLAVPPGELVRFGLAEL